MGPGLLSEFIEKSYIPYAPEHQRGWQSDVRCLRRHVLSYLGAYPLSAVTADTLYRWREELLTSGLSRSTCYRLFWLMKYVLNCAVRRQRLVDDAAFCDPACPRGAQRCPETLSHEEILRTVSLLRQHESNASADAVRLFFLTGASESEILCDRWEDVVFSRSVPVTRRTPSGEVRDIPLSEDGGRLLCPLSKRADVPRLFFRVSTGKRAVSFRNELRLEFGRALPRFHGLRQFFVHTLLQSGATYQQIRHRLGRCFSAAFFFQRRGLCTSARKLAVTESAGRGEKEGTCSPVFLQAGTPVLAAGGMPPFPSRPPRSRKRVFPGDAFVRAVSAGREKFGRKQPCPAVPGVSS